MNSGKFSIAAARPLLFGALLIVILVALIWPLPDQMISRYYFVNQDRWAGLFMAAILVLAAFWWPKVSLPQSPPRARTMTIVCALLTLLLWAGTYWLMFDYALTRDEHMALFDAHILSSGKLAEPLAPEWRDYALALVPAFLMEIPGNEILVSGYMPGNAAMRAAMDWIADDALLNPLLTGLGLFALYRVALRLFPDSPGAVWVVIGGYLVSAQVLTNAMTTYAMTGHLAMNCIWLALFLRGGRWGHLGALLIGVWAIGLHQVVFHPLFAGPFTLTLLAQRRWGLFATYAVVYAAAGFAWMSYPLLVTSLADLAQQKGDVQGGVNFITERVLPLLTRRDAYAIPLMEYNALRFFAWMPAFILPFAASAWALIRKNDGLALPLFGGIALTTLAMFILLPYQGHGHGYRYFHPVLANFLLLAGYGYRRWAERDRIRADGTAWLLGSASALIILPFLLFTTHSFVKPYTALTALISRQTTDFVVVDTHKVSGAIDQVRNWPDLSNRPIVFSSNDLEPAQLTELCSRGTVTLIRRDEYNAVGFQQNLRPPNENFDAFIGDFMQRDCYRRAVP